MCMEKREPIKRSKALVSLSREHHDGLLLCWKIRFGIKNNIDPVRILTYVLYQWDCHLKEHFRKEEEYAFILVPKTDEMRIEAQAQHENLRQSITKLTTQPGYILLNSFAADLEKHIRFEERVLFGHIESTNDEATLTKLSFILSEDRKREEEEWKDNFWLKDNQYVL